MLVDRVSDRFHRGAYVGGYGWREGGVDWLKKCETGGYAIGYMVADIVHRHSVPMCDM